MRLIVIVTVGCVLLAIFLLKGCAHRVPVPEGTIVFLGDSITAGYGLGPGEAYPSLIQIKGMTAINLGVSGSKSDDGWQRLKDYFGGGGAPSLVVIALGANDLLQNVPDESLEANLSGAIQECKTHGVPVLLCGIRIPGRMGADEIYDKVAKDNHVPLLRDLMQGEAHQPDFLQEDHMHPTAEGQRLIALKMQRELLHYFSFGASPQK
jgi:acyl-CoA thioesterase-1